MKFLLRIILPIVVLIALVILSLVIYNNASIDSDDIPGDYIAVFHGGSGELTHETYIYKIDNGHANIGFRYINVTSNTVSWGSSKWEHTITKEGEFDFTDGAFIVAEENGAYSYVTVPNDTKTYTIEEFQSRFIMN